MYAVSGFLLVGVAWEKINGIREINSVQETNLGLEQGKQRPWGKIWQLYLLFLSDHWVFHGWLFQAQNFLHQRQGAWVQLRSMQVTDQSWAVCTQCHTTTWKMLHIHPDSSRWKILSDHLFQAKCGSRWSLKPTLFLSMLPWSIQLLFIYLFWAPRQGRAAKLYLDTSSGWGSDVCRHCVIYAEGKGTPGTGTQKQGTAQPGSFYCLL